jgi:anti-sigma factor RsiW
MTCATLDERLDGWVDGTLPEAERLEVESHLRSCPDCRERERGLRQVLAHAAALPRSVAPPRDLWPGIERRLRRGQTWSWAFLRPGPALALAAAAAVLAVAGTLLWERGPSAVHTVVIPGRGVEGGSVRPAAVGLDPGLVAVERDYQEASNTLLAALEKRKDGLAPETLASVERNRAVIDEALAEIHRALEKDPASPELGRMLVWTHRKKVDVLRRAVKLSTAL